MRPIDLRSDTVTTPTEPMRRAMVAAEVGDDVFGEDPTTIRLEETVAALLGKEAALFVPSGTMGNQLALAVQATVGDEVIVDAQCHILHYETGAPALVSRVQLRAVELHAHGTDQLRTLDEALRPPDYYYPRTRGVCIENTHNRNSGAITPLEQVQRIGAWCAEHNLFLHCDGARLWNASVATGVSLADYAAPCTTVMVCLSKGLGAPVGSLLVGPRELIANARRWRKMLGGGMRQTGILAAAGLYAIEHHFPLLAEDHRRASMFASTIADEFEIMLNPPPTNIVMFRSRLGVRADRLRAAFAQNGVLVSPGPADWLRAVFHLCVDDEQTRQAIEVIRRVHAECTDRFTIAAASP